MEDAPAWGLARGASSRTARLLRFASDEHLVARVRAGDERAFEVLYDRHHRQILGFCRHMLGSREEAEDAVQQTFLAAYRDLVVSRKPIHPRPWLFAIARNRCISILRVRREHVAIEHVEPSTDGLEAIAERRAEVRELLGDLARLPEDQRAALLLAELGALDHEGIATVLGCRREKVKALVFQARSSLAADRAARQTPCVEIRAQLATATGGTLRRGVLRRHLRDCAGCRAFRDEVARQRVVLGIVLPVVPTAALKGSVLAGIGGAGPAAAAGIGAAGGGLVTLGGGTAVKLAVGAALAGSAAGGALTLEAARDRPVPAQPAVRAAPAVAAPAAGIVPSPSAPRGSATTPSRPSHAPTPLGGTRTEPAPRPPAPAGDRAADEARVPNPTGAERRGDGQGRRQQPIVPPVRAPDDPPAHGRDAGKPPPDPGPPPHAGPPDNAAQPPGAAVGKPPDAAPPPHAGGN